MSLWEISCKEAGPLEKAGYSSWQRKQRPIRFGKQKGANRYAPAMEGPWHRIQGGTTSEVRQSSPPELSFGGNSHLFVLLHYTSLSEVIYRFMTSSSDERAKTDDAHYVYIVECTDGTYYTGYTTDVDRRIEEHNEGEGAKYTRGRRPVDLVHVESFDTSSEALRREHAIKQLQRPKKERLVEAGT